MSLCESAYQDLNLPAPRVTTKQYEVATLPDTGAQLVAAGVSQQHRLAITKRELIPPSNGVSTAKNTGLPLLRGITARQTHATESPFHQAASVPKNTVKTVLDAWKGYHSVTLAEEDIHY